MYNGDTPDIELCKTLLYTPCYLSNGPNWVIIGLFTFCMLIRPPDIVCRRTYILPGFLSFFFLFFISLLNGTQPYPATWSEVSVIWKCMSEIWGIPSPYKSGAKNHLFLSTLQLNSKFNGPYLLNETWYTQSVECVVDTSLTRSSATTEIACNARNGHSAIWMMPFKVTQGHPLLCE